MPSTADESAASVKRIVDAIRFALADYLKGFHTDPDELLATNEGLTPWEANAASVMAETMAINMADFMAEHETHIKGYLT